MYGVLGIQCLGITLGTKLMTSASAHGRVIGWVLWVQPMLWGYGVIIYYRQVLLPLGFAWLCERWYRILLIGCLRLSLGCDTWFTS